MNVPLAVYDTMVYLQAAISPHRRYATFEAVEDRRLELCTSDELLAEVRDVLTRPAMARKFSALTPHRVDRFLDKVCAIATLHIDVPALFHWPGHPDDDHLFNLAMHSKANYLVTWETRILELATVTTAEAGLLRRLAPNLEIITPKRLADLLKASK